VLRLMVAGDPVVVWRELREPLAGLIARRVADPQDAEDVLQDVMLRIHRHSDELADADRLAAWVHRIARNAIVDHYRRRAARPELPAGAAGDLEPRADDTELGESASGTLRQELAACLRPLVDRLPESQREALVLTEFEGLSQVEAARRLGISVSGAKARVQRGRAQLKTLLLDCCHVELDRRGGITEYRARRGSCERCRATS
jgi:RNA polymerase sigma-70 factor, ECF subfamily